MFKKTWHSKAADYCEEVPTPRKTTKIQKDIEALEKALKQREKRQVSAVSPEYRNSRWRRRHGATVDEMEFEYARAKHALETATKAYKEFKDITSVRSI